MPLKPGNENEGGCVGFTKLRYDLNTWGVRVREAINLSGLSTAIHLVNRRSA